MPRDLEKTDRMNERILSLGAALAVLSLHPATVRADVVLSGGGLALLQEGPPSATAGDLDVPVNLALGAPAFALDELGVAPHSLANVTDGAYGNVSSWIGGGATGVDGPFVGIDLGGTFLVDEIAFGRSNVLAGDPCGGGVCTDRHLGLYTLQITEVATPDAGLVTTGDPSTGWVDVGTLDVQGPGGANFANPHQRHLYSFDAVVATGVRLIVPATGLATGTAIDELEVYGDPVPLLAGLRLMEEGPPSAAAGDSDVPPNLASGRPAFALDELGGIHLTSNVTDGAYGNVSSWIGNGLTGVDGPFVGVDLGVPVSVGQVAFGRSNVLSGDPCSGGVCTDRTLGLYRVQSTRVASPDETLTTTGDPTTGWADVGTALYDVAGGPDFSFPHRRHLYSFPPVEATGIRLIVPASGLGAGTAVDELEVFGPVPILTGGGLTLLEEGPPAAAAGDAVVPPNLALGAPAFALDELGVAPHSLANVTDGAYGNVSSWIGGGATGVDGPFVGVDLGDAYRIDRFAFGRSNVLAGDPCGGGVCTDRHLGLYTLQVTRAPGPDETLSTTGDAMTGWVDVGTIEIEGSGGEDFAFSHQRHLYGFDPVVATGVRLLVPSTGIATGTAVDELEVFGDPIPLLTGGIVLIEEGPPSATAGDSDVPPNLALGAAAFALDVLGVAPHALAHVTDGAYGNVSSWIGGGATGVDGPFVGVDLGGLHSVERVAFGRSNVLAGDTPCGGVCTDRSLGLYVLQSTTVVSPDATLVTTGDASTGWVDIGTLDYQGVGGSDFAFPHRRHLYEIPPVVATGIRLIVPGTGLSEGTAIDEIEVYGVPVPVELMEFRVD